MIDRRQLASPLGRSSFSILLMQDLAVVPILFLVGVLGTQAEGSAGFALFGALGKALLVIGGIYLGGRLLLRPLFQLVAHSRIPDMFMAATLLVIISAASISGASGLSMALGAFLAGLLLADTEFRHEIEVNIEPFKGLLPVEVGQFMLIVAGLTMIAAPFVAMSASRLSSWMEKPDPLASPAGDLDQLGEWEGHVLIAGFGRVGQLLGRTLDKEGIPHLALDTDAQRDVEQAGLRHLQPGP